MPLFGWYRFGPGSVDLLEYHAGSHASVDVASDVGKSTTAIIPLPMIRRLTLAPLWPS